MASPNRSAMPLTVSPATTTYVSGGGTSERRSASGGGVTARSVTGAASMSGAAAFAAAGAPDVPASARDTDPSIAVVAVRADDVGKSSGRKNFPLLRPGYRDTDVTNVI